MAHSIRNTVLGLTLALLGAAASAAHAQDSMSAKPGDAMKSNDMAVKGSDSMKKDKMGKDAMGSDAKKNDAMGTDAMGKKTSDPMSPKKM